MTIEVYGRDWCEDSTAIRRHLDSQGIPYRYIDIEQSEEGTKLVEAHNGGKRVTPTVRVGGGVLSNPSPALLDEALRQSAAGEAA